MTPSQIAALSHDNLTLVHHVAYNGNLDLMSMLLSKVPNLKPIVNNASNEVNFLIVVG